MIITQRQGMTWQVSKADEMKNLISKSNDEIKTLRN